MKSISVILKEVRNLLPYLLLISIYFLFINLEARKQTTNNKSSEKEKKIIKNESNSKDKQIRITIPVVPYKQ